MKAKKIGVIILIFAVAGILISAGCGQKKAYTGTCYKDSTTYATVCKITETGKDMQCPNAYSSQQCLQVYVGNNNCQNVAFNDNNFTMEC